MLCNPSNIPLKSYVIHDIFFFFNDTATTEIYTLSLHDALPIFLFDPTRPKNAGSTIPVKLQLCDARGANRSEEHTSELQSQSNLVCRLLLEKKKHSQNPYLVALTLLTLTLRRNSTRSRPHAAIR